MTSSNSVIDAKLQGDVHTHKSCFERSATTTGCLSADTKKVLDLFPGPILEREACYSKTIVSRILLLKVRYRLIIRQHSGLLRDSNLALSRINP